MTKNIWLAELLSVSTKPKKKCCLGDLISEQNKGRVRRRGHPVHHSGVIQVSPDMKHNEKNLLEKQWCTDLRCHVTQALHISPQCPLAVLLNQIKLTRMQQSLSVTKHCITSFISSWMHHNLESCIISFTQRCVHGWNILQIPLSSDKWGFIKRRGRGPSLHFHTQHNYRWELHHYIASTVAKLVHCDLWNELRQGEISTKQKTGK